MSIMLRHERDNVYRVEISGTLGEREFAELQAAADAEIQRSGKIRLMIVLSHFNGWAPGRWENLTFYMKHGGDVERIAIIGDERWRAETLMFAGAELRQGSVAFFSPPYRSEAAVWLAAGRA